MVHGTLPGYRQPFDILAEINLAHQKKGLAFRRKEGLFDIWLPFVDVLRNQFAEPSKKMIDTILVAQNQVKDGFLSPDGYSCSAR